MTQCSKGRCTRQTCLPQYQVHTIPERLRQQARSGFQKPCDDVSESRGVIPVPKLPRMLNKATAKLPHTPRPVVCLRTRCSNADGTPQPTSHPVLVQQNACLSAIQHVGSSRCQQTVALEVRSLEIGHLNFEIMLRLVLWYSCVLRAHLFTASCCSDGYPAPSEGNWGSLCFLLARSE